MITATIPARHTAHTLLGTIAWLRADPENRCALPLVWTADPDGMTLNQFMAWFRQALDKKISHREAGRECAHYNWRKLCPDWQRAAYQTAQRVNTPRLIVREREVPLEFRARLAHRLTRPEDL